MGIKVKHSPSAAAIGGTAYTVGRGQRIERDYRFNTEVGLKQQGLNIQAASVANQARAHAASTAQRERESERLAGQRKDELGLRQQQYDEEPARQLQKAVEEQQRLQKNVKWQYNEAQKQGMQKVTQGITWLREQVSGGTWTAEQAEKAEGQLWKKYHSILPLPIYDDTASPQEQLDSRTVTNPITGQKSIMDSKGDFKEMPGSIPFSEYIRATVNAAKLYTTVDENGNQVVDSDAAAAYVNKGLKDFVAMQSIESQAEEIDFRKKTIQDARDKELQEHQEEYAAAAEGQLAGSVEKNMGINPERAQRVAKLKTAYDAEQAKKPPAERKVIPEVDLTKLDKFSLAVIQKFKNMKTVKWSWISEEFGQETAGELKYICQSGNEQAIANALKRLGIN